MPEQMTHDELVALIQKYPEFKIYPHTGAKECLVCGYVSNTFKSGAHDPDCARMKFERLYPEPKKTT
jgi:hypothetical protein